MKTILISEFKHETNRYAAGLTDAALFAARNAVFGEEAIRQRFSGAKNETTGFLDYFAGRADVTLLPVLAFNAQPGAVVAQTVFETVREKLLEAINTVQVDGILLALHGAMVTERYEDGEGELLEALREAVGTQVPIVVTLDLHANVTQKMTANADALFAFDCYPHTDLYETGLRAAACMDKTLSGEICPVMELRKLDIIFPIIGTEDPNMIPLVKRQTELRKIPGILNVNICHGFFYSDIYEQGAAVLVVADKDAVLANQVAAQLADDIWQVRQSLNCRYWTADEAIDYAMATDAGPIVLADVGDNPGSGASTDGNYIFRRLLERGIEGAAVAVIYDPETVSQAEDVGVGGYFQARIGGKIAPDITGEPVSCQAYVKAITDGKYRNRDACSRGLLTNFGKIAVLDVNGIQVLVSSVRTQPWDLEVYRSCGIQPKDQKILVVKSSVHFRASFGTVSDHLLCVEAPATASVDMFSFPLAHSRRPIYPLDAL